MEKEKRDKETKVGVDRLRQEYLGESAGKIRGKAEARKGGSTRRSARKIQSKAVAEEAAGTRIGRKMEGRAATGARSAFYKKRQADERPRSDRRAQRSLG